MGVAQLGLEPDAAVLLAMMLFDTVALGSSLRPPLPYALL
jgi:hypothetical protein